MKKLVIALVAALAVAMTAGSGVPWAEAARGDGQGGGSRAVGSPSGGGEAGGVYSGSRGSHYQGSGAHRGDYGSRHGGYSGRHDGGYYGGRHGGHYSGRYGGYYGGSYGWGLYVGSPWYWDWPWYSGYRYYPPYAYGPYAAYDPPTVYIEAPRADAATEAPAAPANLWYYCTEPAGYYPYVQNCNVAWLKVVPPPSGPTGK